MERELRELYKLRDRLRYWVRAFSDELKSLEEHSREIDNRLKMKGRWIDWRYVNGYGPYACLRWFENGKLRSKYLGKNPDLRLLKLPKREERELENELKSISERIRKLRSNIQKADKIFRRLFMKRSPKKLKKAT